MALCPCELDASSAAAAVVLPLSASGAAPSTGLEAPDAAADATGVCAPADAPLDSAAAAARCEASDALERTRDSEATAGEAPGALEPAAAPLREEPDDMRHAYRRAGRSVSGVGGSGRSAVYRAVRLPRALRVEVVRGQDVVRRQEQERAQRLLRRLSPVRAQSRGFVIFPRLLEPLSHPLRVLTPSKTRLKLAHQQGLLNLLPSKLAASLQAPDLIKTSS